jgi:uncharacterized protein (TIGR02145 family)
MGSFAFFKDFRGRFFCESKYFIKKLQFKQKTILMGIVMKNMFLFGIVASALVLGCSDPVKPDADSSSSVVASSSSQMKSSSSGTSATSSSSTKSSSSTALTSSSSGGLNNSSSSGTSITSSSSTNSSSSTALSSSSSGGLNSSSSTAKSSSSVVTSSSSQPKSSSSYKTQDDIPFGGRSIYDSIYDPRDDHKYLYKTYTANNGYGTILTISVMVQNLDYAEVITLGAEEQDDDTKVEKYCYNDIPQNCDFYGGLYQWAEMMNLPYECNTKSCAELIQEQHQGICPDGWHLITNPEMWVIINSTDEGIEGVKSQAYWSIGGGRNTSGFTLLGAGMRMADGSFMNLNKTAYWYFPTEKDNNEMRAGGGYISGYDNVFGIDNAYNPKVDGVSARCVMDY